jgi:hypothetical protein
MDPTQRTSTSHGEIPNNSPPLDSDKGSHDGVLPKLDAKLLNIITKKETVDPQSSSVEGSTQLKQRVVQVKGDENKLPIMYVGAILLLGLSILNAYRAHKNYEEWSAFRETITNFHQTANSLCVALLKLKYNITN